MTTSRPTGAVIRGAEAEPLGFPAGSSMRLYIEGLGSDPTVSVLRTILRDGVDGAGPHHHATSTELFYVIAGSMQILVDDQVVSANGSDLVVIPPGVTHAFAAAPDHDVEFLDVITPSVERFEHFRNLSEVARGLADPSSIPEDQSGYDTYADDSSAWNQARQEATSHG